MKAELIQSTGDDLTVVNAARVSFNKHKEKLEAVDKKLISFLAVNNHFTPFTHCVLTLREEVPLFVARQRFKHTVGFSYNEVSRRYIDDTPEFFVPVVWRKRATDKKQGSSDEPVNSQSIVKEIYKKHMDGVQDDYKRLLALEVAPEQARMILPQSMLTSYYVTGSLYAFSRAYNLRSSDDAQQEIQQLAKRWDEICSRLFPVSWEALTKQNKKRKEALD